jgi:TolB-like protein
MDKLPGEADQNRKNSKILRKGLISAFGLILLIIGGILFFTVIFKSGEKSEEVEKSIALLPFKLLSDEPDKQYLADGMMDAITLYLSKIQDLRVMSRTSVEKYRETTKTANEIGRELNVEYLLEGSFQKYGDNARLIVQLINVSEDSHAWADEFNSRWSDVFSLQSEVAQKIATELEVVLTPGEIIRMEERPTENLEAYQAYLRGRYYAHQPHFTTQTWNLALQNYLDAVEMDTTFALAYGELAHAHARYIYLGRIFQSQEYKKLTRSRESFTVRC